MAWLTATNQCMENETKRKKRRKKNRKRTDECYEKFPFSCIISDSFNTCALRTDPLSLLRLPFYLFRCVDIIKKMTSNLMESTNNDFHRNRNCEYFRNRNLSRRSAKVKERDRERGRERRERLER